MDNDNQDPFVTVVKELLLLGFYDLHMYPVKSVHGYSIRSNCKSISRHCAGNLLGVVHD